MKIMVVGGGGREHAIAASVAKSSQVDKIYCAPGNAGIAGVAESRCGWKKNQMEVRNNECYFNETVTGSRCSFWTSDQKMEP